MRAFGPVHHLSAYVRGLPPGDRFIATLLGILVAITSLVSVIALERFFLVTVPAYGGSLTEGVVGAPRFVNPVLALSDTDRDLTTLAYAGLMGRSEDGTLVPVLAESYTRSDDQRSYTFIIRQDATFQDGTPVTAEDVVFTVEKAQDPALKSPIRANWANIKAVATDARTVTFTLPEPYAPFLEDATLGILPEHLWKNVTSEEFPFSSLNERPIGAGPFKVTSIVRGSDGSIDRYGLSAFERYALGRPYLDTVSFVFYADQAKLASAVKNGDVESAYGIADKRAIAVPFSRVFGVFFNPAADAALEDRAVRRALSLAIDRDALVEDVLGGYATPAMGPLPASIKVPPLIFPNPDTHAADARAALEDGGWKWSDEAQAWQKDGKNLSVTLKTSNAPELKLLATKIQSDWQAIGVSSSIELYAPTELTQNVIRPRDYSALLFGEVINSYPDLYAFWHSSERKDPGLNIADYADTEVDALLEKARTETDPSVALDDLAQINQMIAADYPAAFTHTPDFLYVVPKNLQGMRLTSVAAPSDRLAGIRYWYRHTERIWPIFAKP